MMPELIAFLCLAAAAGLLATLSVIDLRVRLLPDKLVLPFGLLAFVFHSVTGFHFLSLPQMALGALIGGGVLYGIRCTGNYIYKRDTLGLGDVKLMLAAGLWLGADDVMMAMTLGAACGLLHGMAIATLRAVCGKQPFTLSQLEIPAGPGFAVGIAAMAVYKFSGIMGFLS